MPSLRRLHVICGSVTDEGLRSLTALRQLKKLAILRLKHLCFGTVPCELRPRDACLRHLGTMSHLEKLDLRGVPVTATDRAGLETLAKLRAALPNCKVIVSPEVQKALDESGKKQ